MSKSDNKEKKSGIDIIQEKVLSLQQGGDPQYILAAITPELIEKAEYSKVSVGGRSDRIITLHKSVHPFTFTTYLKSQGTSKLKSIFNTFNNAQLTSLTPMIKFFLRGSTSKDVISIPLQNVHNRINPHANALDSVNRKYSYLGIKNIEMDLKGDSPETRKADIETTITFYGNNLSLFEKEGQGENYLPLIVPYYMRKGSKNQKGNQYQLLMQVGWNIPTSSTKRGLKFTKEQVSAVEAQHGIYIMRYYSHSFSFNEDGSFLLKVSYISALDEHMKSINFMEPSSNEVEKIINSSVSSKSVSKKPTSGPIASAINDFISTYAPSVGKDATTKIFNHLRSKPEDKVLKEIERLENSFSKRDSIKLKDLIRTLLSNRAGFTTTLSPAYVHHLYFDIVGVNYMEEFYANHDPPIQGGNRYVWLENARQNLITTSREEAGKDFNVSQISTDQVKTASDTLMLAEQDFISSYSPGSFTGVYNFFKFGDIITAFLVSCNGEKFLKENDMKIILGNIRIPTKSKGFGSKNKSKVITASLYDIPIALESLMKVIHEEYVSTTRKRLTLRTFISSILNKIIKPYYLEKDYILDHKPAKGVIRSGQIVVPTSAADKIKDNITEAKLKKINLRNPRIDLADAKKEDRELTMLYYINASLPSPPMNDKILKDFDRYHIGSSQSIVKKINFTQANSAVQKARADDNVVASLRNEESVIIPQVYNVSLDVVGNINFYPGYCFHLHPALLGLAQDTKDSVLKDLGLTGTYMTIKVSHSFSSDGFTTSLEAYNVFVGRKEKG